MSVGTLVLGKKKSFFLSWQALTPSPPLLVDMSTKKGTFFCGLPYSVKNFKFVNRIKNVGSYDTPFAGTVLICLKRKNSNRLYMETENPPVFFLNRFDYLIGMQYFYCRRTLTSNYQGMMLFYLFYT